MPNPDDPESRHPGHFAPIDLSVRLYTYREVTPITRNRAEYAAFRSSRLVGFFLSQGLHRASVVKKMERLLALWPAIEAQGASVDGGAMFELPTTSTRVKQLKV